MDYLNESKGGKRTRGANVTSVDAAIRYVAPDGATEIALIEWKYTEAYPSPSPKPDAAKNATRRSRYEDLWGSVVRTDLLDLEDLFVEPIYQMLRQQMLAHEMEQAHELGADRVRVVYAAPAANAALWSSLSTPTLREFPDPGTEGPVDDIRLVWDALRLEPDRFVHLDTAWFVGAIHRHRPSSRTATRTSCRRTDELEVPLSGIVPDGWFWADLARNGTVLTSACR